MKRRLFILGVLFATAHSLFLGWTADEKVFTNSLGMRMIRIEAGSYLRGSQGARDFWPEQPVHEVSISKPFYISETEVTLEQFRRFRPDFEGTAEYAPYVAGVSWHDAVAFAEWLSEREKRPYRLPTEAEWEYVARAGGGRPAEGPGPQLDQPNASGVKNMLAGVREWCRDWFGAYPAGPLRDPVGPSSGFTKVVRGGALDSEERNFLKKNFYRPEARLSMAPSFGIFRASAVGENAAGERLPGLVGVWFGAVDWTEPRETMLLQRLQNNWQNDPRGGGRWSARWTGHIQGPHTGPVTFEAEVDGVLVLEIGGQRILDIRAPADPRRGSIEMMRGAAYPITLSFVRHRGSQFKLSWSWPGKQAELVPETAVWHSPEEERQAERQAGRSDFPGFHAIGFRLVQAALPETEPYQASLPLVQQRVKQVAPHLTSGPNPDKPYFRKRYLFPMPPDNAPGDAIDALGMHPSFRPHNHSPALEVLPNGDLLTVIYTSYREYEPGVSLTASRLRYGAEQWDFPSPLFDFVGVNDHAPLLWNDSGVVHLFWGNPQLQKGGFPFQWTSTRDSGATWDEIRFPLLMGRIGSHTPQPINSAFRGPQGTMYIPTDGSGGESVLWASQDEGRTWFDTGGRSAGRHTTYVLLKDGSILGMGGKNTDIDEYMPKAVSRDGGRTWEASKTPFARQGSNQRPTLIRLKSGRLFFAGDFVHHNSGSQPPGLNQLGSYVALSEDEGASWYIRKLVGAQLHENPARAERMKGPTLGYSVARQAPNGVIHLITTMNNPCLHFEFNEAWILKGSQTERPDTELMAPTASRVERVKTYEERYPDGRLKASWSGGVADDGRFLLHGTEKWYYPDGTLQWEVNYGLGRKTGDENFYGPDGKRLWSWNHREDGTGVWTQWWAEGTKKAESNWVNFKAHGPARRWDRSAQLLQDLVFAEGILQRTP